MGPVRVDKNAHIGANTHVDKNTHLDTNMRIDMEGSAPSRTHVIINESRPKDTFTDMKDTHMDMSESTVNSVSIDIEESAHLLLLSPIMNSP